VESTSSSIRLQNFFPDLQGVTNGWRQEDALASILFNKGLQKVIIDSCVQTSGHTVFLQNHCK
jgi:hypothetical protein